MKMKFFQADAFTSIPFKGNPAAICILEKEIPDLLKQNIASENNLSETAFLFPMEDEFSLQWFTPTAEVPLCGHATLASAHILWEQGICKQEILKFQTKSGLLTAKKNGDWIELNFPAYTCSLVSLPPELSKLLPAHVKATYVSGNRYLVELDSEDELRNFQPDFTALGKFNPIILTAIPKSPSPYDFISRFFAPSIGVDEDPVTGSVHCILVPFWSNKLMKTELFAYQASPRGGELRLSLQKDRVTLSGQAITVICGVLRISQDEEVTPLT